MVSRHLKNFPETYLNNITLGDCLEHLKNIPDDSIDVCFADPPFNLKKKYNNYKDNLDEDEYLTWCESWLIQLIRVIKPTGSLFIHNIPDWLIKYSFRLNNKPGIFFKKWIVWDAMSGANSSNLHPSHYGILYYVRDIKKAKFYKIRYPHKRERTTKRLYKDWGGKKDSLHPYGPLVTDVWSDIHRVKHQKFKDNHPCQLPIHLLQRIILMSSDSNDIILDPFMGTGTTAIAAKSLGRNYIGFEQNEEYVGIANNKLSLTDSNSQIGNAWVSYYNGEIQTIRDKDWISLERNFELPEDKKDLEFKKISLKNEQFHEKLRFKFYTK